MKALRKLKFFNIGLLGLAILTLIFDAYLMDRRYGLIAMVIILMGSGLELIRHILNKLVLKIEDQQE